MNTIIEKIRAEIERRRTFHKKYYEEGCGGVLLAYMEEDEHLLSFLSDLEKSEKPMNQEGLEEEAESCWRIVFPDGGIETTKMALTHDEFMMCARHFYELGRQSKPKVSDGLETEALRSAGVLLSEHFEDEDDDAIRTTALRCWKGGVIHGASWQKEQMMKEAVEGKIRPLDEEIWVEKDSLKGFEDGDKVRVIICKKED